MRGSPTRLGAAVKHLPAPTRLPHTLRTITHPRCPTLHSARITHICSPTAHLRKLTLEPTSTGTTVNYAAGQWVDLHIPTLAQPGGFTLISVPLSQELQLSVRRAPGNPAAEWVFSGATVGSPVHVRVGGSFVFPPPARPPHPLRPADVRRVVMCAGGVGINPFLAMVGWIAATRTGSGSGWPAVDVKVLWSARPGEWAYLDRFDHSFVELRRFETAGNGSGPHTGRIALQDLNESVRDGGMSPDEVLVYVCGPKGFERFCIDGFVAIGVDKERVLFEQWW